MSQPEALFKTNNLSLSAYLVTMGHSLEEFQLEDIRCDGLFIFRKDLRIAESISAFYTEDPAVSIRLFLKNLNICRDMVGSEKRKLMR